MMDVHKKASFLFQGIVKHIGKEANKQKPEMAEMDARIRIKENMMQGDSAFSSKSTINENSQL